MPNIEIYLPELKSLSPDPAVPWEPYLKKLGDRIGAHYRKCTEAVIEWVREKVSTLPFAEDAVVTPIDAKCTDIDGNPAPFIRISSTKKDHFELLVEALKPLGLDIELNLLHNFIPAEK